MPWVGEQGPFLPPVMWVPRVTGERADSQICSVLAPTLPGVGVDICVSREKARPFSAIQERKACQGSNSVYPPPRGLSLRHVHDTSPSPRPPVICLQLEVWLQLQTFLINLRSLPESCCELLGRKAFKVTLHLSPESKPCVFSFLFLTGRLCVS